MAATKSTVFQEPGYVVLGLEEDRRFVGVNREGAGVIPSRRRERDASAEHWRPHRRAPLVGCHALTMLTGGIPLPGNASFGTNCGCTR